MYMIEKSIKNAVLDQGGLTLLHVMIGLLLLSLFFVPFAHMEKLKDIREKRQDEINRIADINQELIEYAARTGVYPAPADPTLPVTNANHGFPVSMAGFPVSGTCNAGTPPVSGVLCRPGSRAVAGGANPDVLIGTLPINALGLNLHDGIDPYGQKYTYIVSRNLVENSLGTITPSAVSGQITITGTNTDFVNSYVGQEIQGNGGRATIVRINSATNIVVDVDVSAPFADTSAIAPGGWSFVGDRVLTNDQNGVIDLINETGGPHAFLDGDFGSLHFAVVGHGENGAGAYLSSGVQVPCPVAGNIEAENCDGDATIVAMEAPDLDGDGVPDTDRISDGVSVGLQTFDDVVRVSGTIFNSNWAKATNNALIMAAGTDASDVAIGFNGTPAATLHVSGDVRADSSVETDRLCNSNRQFCFDSYALTHTGADAALKCPSTRGLKRIVGENQTSDALNIGEIEKFCDQKTRLRDGLLSNDCENGARGFDASGNLICRTY